MCLYKLNHTIKDSKDHRELILSEGRSVPAHEEVTVSPEGVGETVLQGIESASHALKAVGILVGFNACLL